jgi:type II secretory pathway pseudopilin PulG
MKKQGFTLLETIIYCALFSILMTSAIGTVFALMDSTTRTKNAISIIAEANFVNQKLTWLFNGTVIVTIIDAHTIRITRADLGADNPVTLQASSSNLFLTRGSSQPKPLTGSPFIITNFSIDYDSPDLIINYAINGNTFRFESYVP